MSNDTEKPPPKPVPSFLGIGAQKAGTTWLWENLRVNGHVFLPRRKELHYLDQHWDRGYEWYCQHFRPRRVRNRRPGEITPAYLVVPQERIEAMHAINPDIRLILMVREPVERAWSAAKYFVRNQRKQEITELPFAEFQQLVTTPLMLQRGDYLEGMRRWGGVFGTDRLLTLFHDDVVSSPAATLERALRHIRANGPVDPTHYPLGEVFNRGPSTSIPERHRTFLSEVLEDQTRGLAAAFPDHDADWLAAARS